MEIERHEKADNVVKKIQAVEKEIASLKGSKSYPAIFVGTNGNGATFRDERKEMFYQMALSLLKGDLEKLKEIYKEV
jgi:hypothetical protein